MRSSFFEFNVATSALFTARGGLDTVNHNIANASVRGYSRQYVEQRATQPLRYFNSRGMIGTGSEIYGIQQVRSFYLDKKYWSESAVLGEYTTKGAQLSFTESIFNEMSGMGLSGQFADFFSRLSDLSTTSGDSTYRTNVTQLGQSMTTFIKNTYESLQKQQRDINHEIAATVKQINSLGDQICSLNRQITQFEVDGSTANDLRDERIRLVDELSKYVNVEVKEVEMNQDYALGKYPNPEDRGRSEKQFMVFINGTEFVNHYRKTSLECKERKEYVDGSYVEYYNNPEDSTGLYDIYWSTTGQKFDIYHPNLKGELKGLIDIRDGNNGNYLNDTTFSAYDATPGAEKLTLKIDYAKERVDLNKAGGILTVTDAVTGQKTEVHYKSYTYDITTGEAVFELVNVKPNFQALLTNTNNTITSGQTTDYKGIPYYISRLNDLVRTFAKAMNEGKYMDGRDIPDVTGHINGFDANDENLQALFFTYMKSDGTQAKFDSNFNIYEFNASNFYMNSELLKNPSLLAASDKKGSGISNNQVILNMLNINHTRTLFREGSIQDYIVSMTGEMAIDARQAQLFEENYTDVILRVENQRLSVSGVDLNEEMIIMVRYQQQYQAAAKLMNIIDAIYDYTINRMGAF